MTRTRMVVGFIIILLITLGGTYGLLRYKGYTILNGKLVRTAMLEVQTPVAGTKIFVDQFPAGESTTAGEILTAKGVSPGNHNILVAKEGYWPWSKVLPFSENSTVVVNPFLTRRSPNFDQVVASREEVVAIKNAITTYTLPTKENPLASRDGTTKIWVEYNVVRAQIENATAGDVLTKNEPITGLDFYNNRNDVIVSSTSQSIFATELDKVSNQNSQSIVISPNNGFYIDKEENLLYVLVNKNIFSMAL